MRGLVALAFAAAVLAASLHPDVEQLIGNDLGEGAGVTAGKGIFIPDSLHSFIDGE